MFILISVNCNWSCDNNKGGNVYNAFKKFNVSYGSSIFGGLKPAHYPHPSPPHSPHIHANIWLATQTMLQKFALESLGLFMLWFCFSLGTIHCHILPFTKQQRKILNCIKGKGSWDHKTIENHTHFISPEFGLYPHFLWQQPTANWYMSFNICKTCCSANLFRCHYQGVKWQLSVPRK